MTPKIVFVWLSYNMHLSYGHGIGMLTAVAKEAGADVSVYHVHQDLGNPPDEKKCANDISQMNPDLVGIGSSSLEWAFAKSLAQELRKVCKAKIVAGGPHITFSQDSEGYEFFDHLISGEGEKPICDFISGKFSQQKKIVGELIKDIDTLPFSDRESFQMQKIIDSRGGIIDFISQRGCPYNCSYCSNNALLRLYGAGYLRQRSPQNMIKEIQMTQTKYNFKTIFFHDDIFTLRKDYALEFCEIYKKEIHLPWMINSHVNHMDDDSIDALAKAGLLEVKLGVESGDEEMRRKILNKKISDDFIIERFKAIHDRGIRTFAFIMHGLPGFEKDSYQKSVSLMSKVKPNVIRSSIFFPLPNTVLGNSYHLVSNEKNVSMVGDRPASVLDHGKKTLMEFYTFGWNINLLLGLKEYGDLIKKYSSVDNIDAAKIKEEDLLTSQKFVSLGKVHYRFGPECSMIKLQDKFDS